MTQLVSVLSESSCRELRIGVLWTRYGRANHGGAIFNHGVSVETGSMAGESTKRKDTLKVEKVSLLVLTLCIAVLVYLLAVRPF